MNKVNKTLKVQAVKNQTRYDCPKFISKGGHCGVTSYISRIDGGVHNFGCKWPNDISKCPHLKRITMKQHKLW